MVMDAARRRRADAGFLGLPRPLALGIGRLIQCRLRQDRAPMRPAQQAAPFQTAQVGANGGRGNPQCFRQRLDRHFSLTPHPL